MKIDLVSKDFENYLLKKLNIADITLDNLKEIKEISLNGVKEKKQIADYDFKDFEKLENLKYLSLQNFIITNYKTNAINRCQNLQGIQFANCILKSKSRLQADLKFIAFDNCKHFKIYYLSLLKKLEILKLSNLKLVNLSKINILINLEKIYFENEIIINFGKLKQLKRLLYIRITKCKWNRWFSNKGLKQIEIEKGVIKK